MTKVEAPRLRPTSQRDAETRCKKKYDGSETANENGDTAGRVRGVAGRQQSKTSVIENHQQRRQPAQDIKLRRDRTAVRRR